MSDDRMTKKEFRRFLRHLMDQLRKDKCHRELRHSMTRAIETFFYEGGEHG
jgi:hypothetical protein